MPVRAWILPAVTSKICTLQLYLKACKVYIWQCACTWSVSKIDAYFYVLIFHRFASWICEHVDAVITVWAYLPPPPLPTPLSPPRILVGSPPRLVLFRITHAMDHSRVWIETMRPETPKGTDWFCCCCVLLIQASVTNDCEPWTLRLKFLLRGPQWTRHL